MIVYLKKTDTVCPDFQSRLFKLSQHRIEKTLSKKQEKDRLLSLVSGELIDFGLKEYGLKEADMEYTVSHHGKPEFLNHPHIHFNISHSQAFAVCVFSDAEIGVDIEKIDNTKDIEKLMNRYYSDNERKFVLNSENPHNAFFMLWTRKESYLKAKGTGISVGLKDTDVVEEEKDGFYFNSIIYAGMYITVCSKECEALELKVIE